MQQLVQNSRSGAITVKSVPPPALKRGMVLVRTCYSVISAGTERSKVELGKKSLLGKAMARPDLVRLVLKQIKEQGLLDTASRVLNKLGTDSAMGYSSAGVVVEVADDVSEFRVGDKVACAGGGYASHAELVVVPKNLVAKVPEGVSLQDAAYTTLGAIALQGIRQAAPTLGESVMVIGLGLLGQLLIQLLKANGCRVIGVDINPDAIALAQLHGADLALVRSEETIKEQILAFTGGYGVDAVIITASTTSNDPVEFAAEVLRDRGRVVMVGVTGMNLPRSPYYLKELEFKLSRSYGAGRYDTNYEEKGMDYPIGYVRWTEKRNMQAFLQLVAEKKVSLQHITTHTFPIEQGEEAYKLITGERKERYIGILLDYGEFELSQTFTHLAPQVAVNGTHTVQPNAKRIAFIGAGSFATGYLIPHLRAIAGVELEVVCNATGLTAESVRQTFGFKRATSSVDEVLGDPHIGTVFIATRHNLHAELVIKALQAEKHVFVEKPLAIDEKSLWRIAEEAEKRPHLKLLTGFNRRFSAPIKTMKSYFRSLQEPISVQYRINAGSLPPDHWTQDLDEGGGRLIGEVCHFIDTIQYLTDSEPVRVYAEMLPTRVRENLLITIRLANGSVGTIQYLCNGDKLYPKERIEIFGGNRIAIMENFKTVVLSEQGAQRIRSFSGGKGHKEEVEAFIDSLDTRSSPISLRSQVLTTLATFRINQSLNTGMPEEL
ncbi:MAG: bi-domain-containing oxidoreductase [Chloroherpetonaceae bacterium]|nr:bi-domain-containing oxidoreductase [Chloroherpetonaceae bacterium]MDW8020194.1 bi-domain-containing oxidoreductase [Chloroherpetonaceae bacterium]